MPILLWVFAFVLGVMCAIVVGYVAACAVVIIYNVIKMALVAIYDDLMAVRHAMARDAARLRAVKSDEAEVPTGRNGPTHPPLAEALGHVIRHPSMDGLSTGVDNSVQTRFNRN